MSVRLKRDVAKYRRPSSADLDGGPQRRFSDNRRIGKGSVGPVVAGSAAGSTTVDRLAFDANFGLTALQACVVRL
jgi:hypothetical protein